MKSASSVSTSRVPLIWRKPAKKKNNFRFKSIDSIVKHRPSPVNQTGRCLPYFFCSELCDSTTISLVNNVEIISRVETHLFANGLDAEKAIENFHRFYFSFNSGFCWQGGRSLQVHQNTVIKSNQEYRPNWMTDGYWTCWQGFSFWRLAKSVIRTSI